LVNLSAISWLDFSESDRRKMVQVISLFKQRDTRDEMGLAQIRDGFAEMFFPGTTTIQTRARYFLLVPWSYLYLEKRKTPSSKVEESMRNIELQVMDELEKSGETQGVIGQISGKNLQRFPSSIYWNGLRTWEILRFPGHQQQYHRSLDHFYRSKGSSHEKESPEYIIGPKENWDPNLPDVPSNFPDQATFDVSKVEAEYLSERLLISCNRSLLAYLVNNMSPVDVAFGWLHPEKESFPDNYQKQLRQARNFSETMQGTALLYNLLLAEKRGSEDLISEFRERLSEWVENLRSRENNLLDWDRHEFWMLISHLNVYLSTQKFVNDWLSLLLDGEGITNPIENDEMRSLVHFREYRLKGKRSRLENQRHLELWSGDAGTSQLDFRWRIGNQIARDIQHGLRRER
jgi:hypothetical protein